MSVRYFQLGGFRGNISSSKSLYDEKELASTIAGPSSPLRPRNNPEAPIGLILGIKKSGTSHLLLTTDQAHGFSRSLSIRGTPLSAQDFESLSPISFDTVDALNKKMSALKPKAGKNQQRDSSQANRIYEFGGIEIYRGAFEHGRILYQIWNGLPDPTIYGCYDTSWLHGLRVSSFIFNMISVDDRVREERIRNPHILDVGFCSATLPGLIPDDSTAHHIVNRNNALLGGKRTSFTHGTSETIDRSLIEIEGRVNEFFKEHKHRSSTPTILLIYNEEMTRGYLDKLNVDTSAWTFDDLKDLAFAGSSNTRSSYSDRPRYDSHYRSGGSRSRSRSPTRRPDPRAPYHSSSFQSNRANRHPEDRYGSMRSSSSSSTQNPSNERTKLYPPVYVVDIQKLYNKLMSNDQVKSLRKVAEHILETNVEGICAGNEAALAIDIWKAMISGLSIDEQRELRLSLKGGEETLAESSSGAGPSKAQSQSQPPLAEADSEEEEDPNAYVAPKGGPSKPQATQQRNVKSFSDSDYGDDDDSDSDSD